MKAAQISLLGGSGLLFALAILRLALAFGGESAPALPNLSGGAYVDQAPAPLQSRSAVWNEPPAQSGGEDWVFEVFTPPIIYFNPETKEFTLTPPVPRAARPPFGLEVVSLERELYRLQFAGYVGEEGRYQIEIRNRETGEFLRGRIGETFAEADFTIEGFSATRHLVEPEDPTATPYVETVIELTIKDLRSGETLTLTDSPRYGKRPLVTVRTADGAMQALFPGGTVTEGETTYTVTSADLSTKSVTIDKHDAAGNLLETKTFALEPLSP